MKTLVQKVELKSRPDLEVYVRALTAFEDSELRESIRSHDSKTKEGERALICTMLAGYLCDANGNRLFMDDQSAATYIAENRLMIGGCWKIVNTAQKFNALSDEAVEEELKN